MSTYYGTKRNILGVILAGLVSLIMFILSIVSFTEKEGGIGIFMLLVAGGAGFLAYLIYTNVRPSFALMIETLYPRGTIKGVGLSYGSQSFALGQASSRSPFAALTGAFRRLFGLGTKYRFEMDPATGE